MSELRQKYKDFLNEIHKLTDETVKRFKDKESFSRKEAESVAMLTGSFLSILRDEDGYLECISEIEKYMKEGEDEL